MNDFLAVYIKRDVARRIDNEDIKIIYHRKQ